MSGDWNSAWEIQWKAKAVAGLSPAQLGQFNIQDLGLCGVFGTRLCEVRCACGVKPGPLVSIT